MLLPSLKLAIVSLFGYYVITVVIFRFFHFQKIGIIPPNEMSKKNNVTFRLFALRRLNVGDRDAIALIDKNFIINPKNEEIVCSIDILYLKIYR